MGEWQPREQLSRRLCGGWDAIPSERAAVTVNRDWDELSTIGAENRLTQRGGPWRIRFWSGGRPANPYLDARAVEDGPPVLGRRRMEVDMAKKAAVRKATARVTKARVTKTRVTKARVKKAVRRVKARRAVKKAVLRRKVKKAVLKARVKRAVKKGKVRAVRAVKKIARAAAAEARATGSLAF